ncbi:hypothetical protein BXY82_1154 [Gelidibacter sediminis]|uniref:Uncharacterized protein n=1 Tax=Gelidibacter sediminis TaxID=1608710 RepID=A0A4V3F9C9_9FLAO|nr:hypothetical protein [Gelidibacter sediminis]TDU43736.1 hypothetical protein BXY82_1154 [Gelidibacter sediminis]
MAIVLFMSSSLNTYALQVSDCEAMATEIHGMLQDAGVDHATAYEISGQALEACENAN